MTERDGARHRVFFLQTRRFDAPRFGPILVPVLLLASCARSKDTLNADVPPCRDAPRTPVIQPSAGPGPSREVRSPSTAVDPTTSESSVLESRRFSLFGTKLQLDLSPSPAPLTAEAYEAYLAEVRRMLEARWIYPPEALQRRQSGRGALRFDVVKDGSVRCITIDRSSGVAVLDRAFVDAVRQAILPTTPEGAPDSFSITVNFTYTLSPRPRPGTVPVTPLISPTQP